MDSESTERTAIERVCRDLGLPKGDLYSQDWAYEIPDTYRTIEWIDRYLSAYKSGGYQSTEQKLLVKIILDVINDILESDEPAGRDAWMRTVETIQDNIPQHRQQIEYWAAESRSLEDAFALSPLARELITTRLLPGQQ